MYLKDIIITQKDSNKVAIKYKDIEFTYKQFYHQVVEHVNQLEQVNINKCVGIFLPNSSDYALAYFAITFLDKVIIPINVDLKGLEIHSTIDYCNLNLIITNSEYKPKLLEKIVKDDRQVMLYTVDDHKLDLIGEGDRYTAKDDVGDDVAIMLHTSGTTSNPKRVMLTHKNLFANIQSNITSLQLTAEERCLIALPMFFGYCNTAQFLTHLYLGATIVIMDNFFLPQQFFLIVHKEGITNFTGVPSMLLMMLKFKRSLKHELTTLRYICFGGSSIPVEKLQELMKMFPHTGFVQTYGQTEASPRVTALLPEDSITRIGSVGKTIPGVELRIVNEDYQDVVPQEIGEVIVKGANVMKGYYKRPEETAKVIKNGWLHTNDLGYFDQDGFIYLVGRKKNMLISGGINIYPEEIEEIIVNHSHVDECRVYGIKHDLLLEVPAVKIVLKEDIRDIVTAEEILDYCRENLAEHKVPYLVEFVRELPKTVTGKIRRHALKTVE